MKSKHPGHNIAFERITNDSDVLPAFFFHYGYRLTTEHRILEEVEPPDLTDGLLEYRVSIDRSLCHGTETRIHCFGCENISATNSHLIFCWLTHQIENDHVNH